jgi:predicted transcriptional regulator/predicted RNase H-like HicB family nuclease
LPRNFIALIHKEADSDYGVSFPDLPGCVTAGVDLDDARGLAEEALALHLEGMEADHDSIPEPSSLEAIMQDRENRDAVAILVKAPAKVAKAVRINITVPEDELEEIDRYAAEQGYSRSGFLVHAAKKLAAEAAKPAVPPKESITSDYIICLEDGRKFKSLKRHLWTQYNLSPEEYRAKWGLPSDYPMVAPAYAKARAALAKQMGLGVAKRRA